ncbi:MAG: NADH-quinone oxidoreductase subunit C [Desulfovibrio sp.]|jgi:ech hydrogenase subunit D|nr:NADH-quinone oxidoreductase subunit C [Desulfovibrio sp.]
MFFEAVPVTPETLLGEVRRLAEAKYRFVTMSQTVLDEHTLCLYYHFDENLTLTDLRRACDLFPQAGMTHLRMEVDKDRPIPSISSIYFCALLIENETQDQFGVRFEGLPLDYQGAMYLEGEVARGPYFTMTTVRRASGEALPKGPGGEQQ